MNHARPRFTDERAARRFHQRAVIPLERRMIPLEPWEVRLAVLERDAIRCEHIAGDDTLALTNDERDMLLTIASKLQLIANAIVRRRRGVRR